MIILREGLLGQTCLILFLIGNIVKISFGQYQQYPGQYPPVYTNQQQYNPPYNPQYNPRQPSSGVGYRDYGDQCQPKASLAFPTDESALCDLGRGLTCTHFQCTCIAPGAIYRHGKCRAKVARPCESTDGTSLECIVNAECNSATRLCQCKRSYWANDESTACNQGGKLRINSWHGCVLAYKPTQPGNWSRSLYLTHLSQV
ncbi:unnamed protein product [Allacma fusca]|uniref:Uncharacterized protein n=1 Tax=Allacma fusca TaxID=39272 RepID=A0A8J2LE45_9HEXA|nr:unnamed protein product [Allacma fusca]